MAGGVEHVEVESGSHVTDVVPALVARARASGIPLRGNVLWNNLDVRVPKPTEADDAVAAEVYRQLGISPAKLRELNRY